MRETLQPGLANDLNAEPERATGYLLGLLGALTGAILGVVPWFLVSTFASFYIGWLGFLVGWVSLWGYRALRGAKKTGYATAVIFICSILSIVAANFVSDAYSVMRGSPRSGNTCGTMALRCRSRRSSFGWFSQTPA